MLMYIIYDRSTTHLGYQEPQILEIFKTHTSDKIVLGSFPSNGPETSSRNDKQNFDEGKDRQTVSMTELLNSIYEHKRRVW